MAVKEIYSARIGRVVAWLKEHKVAGCIVNDPINLFYYTGIHISTGVLYISAAKTVLMVDHRYYDRCKKLVPMATSAVKNFKESLSKFKFPKKIAMDSCTTFLRDYELISQFTEVVSYPNFLAQKRMIKDKHEIKLIKKSCQITTAGFQYIQKHFKEGVTEIELKQKLEQYLLKLGSEKMAFDPIIAFGKNAANPHYSPAAVKLKKNDLVLIDCGSVYKGYHSDMTRTYVLGTLSRKMLELIELTATAQEKAIALCKPKVKVIDLYHEACRVFKQNQVLKLFIHGLGHGVGLEVHELPVLGSKDMVLEPGMVITIEPGLYVPGLGGVRIEDTLLITEKGALNLTKEHTNTKRKGF